MPIDRFRQNPIADLSLRWMGVCLLAWAGQDVLTGLMDRRDYPDFVLDATKIPMNRSHENRSRPSDSRLGGSRARAIAYGSAIAPRLSPVLHHDAREIASELVARLQDRVSEGTNDGAENGHLGTLMAPYRSLTVMPTGWIVMAISDRGMATWLQHCLSQIHVDGVVGTALGCSPGEKTLMSMDILRDATPTHDVVWKAQYAHARCCACLRMASEVGIDLDHPLSWLEGDRLRFHSPPEQQLLGTILDTVDDLHNWLKNHDSDQGSDDQVSHAGTPKDANAGAIAPKVALRRLQALSDDVLAFYGACRLFGDVLTGDRPLATTRLGLLLIAQTLLRTLLEGVFNEVAPTSL